MLFKYRISNGKVNYIMKTKYPIFVSQCKEGFRIKVNKREIFSSCYPEKIL